MKVLSLVDIVKNFYKNFLSLLFNPASGFDLFVKYGASLRTRFNGWMAYSFLHARRLFPRHTGDGYFYERAPAPFDITHNSIAFAGAGTVFSQQPKQEKQKPVTQASNAPEWPQ